MDNERDESAVETVRADLVRMHQCSAQDVQADEISLSMTDSGAVLMQTGQISADNSQFGLGLRTKPCSAPARSAW